MQNIHHIRFTSHPYAQVDPWIVILHQLGEPPIIIPLPTAHLIKFLQSFDDMSSCQKYITTNNPRPFILFGHGENIQTWLYNNNIIPNNLEDIIIFGADVKESKRYYKTWTRRYTQKVRDVLSSEQLERELILFGMKHIENIRDEVKEQSTLNLLNEDFEQLQTALYDCLQRTNNKLDNDIAMSVETS